MTPLNAEAEAPAGQAKHTGTIELMGFTVCALPPDELLEHLWQQLELGKGARIVTLNPEIAVQALEQSRLLNLLQSADCIVADGIGISLAARLLGRPPLARYPGIELAHDLLSRCAAEGRSAYLIGGQPGVAREAAGNLTRALPGLNICGVRDGYFTEGEAAAVAEEIGSAAPDLILAGMGFPRQEEFIAAHRQAFGAALLIGVGGALDVFAGRQSRAPVWIRRIHLEWAYRVARNATRLRRLGAIPRFLKLVLRESIGAAN